MSDAAGGGGRLRLHVAERADALVTSLAAVLSAPPADPFTPDVVAVPTRGVERWVAQRLAHHLGTGPREDGVCANVRFDPPRTIVREALAATIGIEPDHDPWHPDRLPWHVLAVLDEEHGSSWLATISRYLGQADDHLRRSRRLRLAQRLARLLQSYDEQRPALVRAWADGLDQDGAGTPLAADLVWQAELWRRLRSRLDVPAPALRIDDAVGRLAAEPDVVDLPERLSVFGPTALPDAHVRVLHALATHREVHLWLPSPSHRLWERVAAAPGPPVSRRRDTGRVAQHPMLESMASDATELESRLLVFDPLVTWVEVPEPPRSVLGALQTRLRDDRSGGARHDAGAHDRSVQVHAAHGRTRQVEVLRDALAGLLADDPTLQPRDIVVMCPDVELFAPLVEAIFEPAVDGDAPETHPGRTLRVRIADRAPARSNPVLTVLATVLELADSRVTASAVVDLAGQAPVRRRFGLDEDALNRVRAWALESGVHWGEDAQRRARFQLGNVPQGTWSTALDRLLLGVAMAEDDNRFVGSVLPIDDVPSTDVDLAGRLAEFLDRLTVALAGLTGAQPAEHWFAALERAVDLLTDVAPADRWQRAQAAHVVTTARLAATSTASLRLADIVALLEPHLRGRPTRAGFRTGALTVCSLEPMRAVPHRVVALIGMDDGQFPRAVAPDGDDVLARDPLVGERDPRQEDRQLFLDAVTSAEDCLLIVHSGADERTGAVRPPAVPVGELLDALDDAVAYPDGAPARTHVVHHPLQTVDERNFTAGALGRPGPFAFDRLDLAAALAARHRDWQVRPFLAEPLPPQVDDDLDLEELVTALEHPVRAFIRVRLGVRLPGDEPQLDDRLPLEMGALERWSVGDRLLAAGLDGIPLDQTAAAERRRGHMPPGALGGAALASVRNEVDPLLVAARRHLDGPGTPLEVDVELPGGRRLAGTVHGVRGDVVARAVYSRLGPKHRLRAWVHLLALTASHPDRRLTAVTVARGDGASAQPRVAKLRAPGPDDAMHVLRSLVELYDEALREPLPLPLQTSWAYARHRVRGGDEEDALAAARKDLGSAEDARQGRGGFECADAHHVLVWGDDLTFDDLLGPPSQRDRERAPHESTRFGALSVALWSALDRHEEVGLG
ncbi:exodeoxyribonuclease V subunit gamma [Cellulomonas alba]|uniref:RecBCD enzyme subunit RecC n=1 Tax=Cellulomonas alba TaxID=3053467 RepID=A0ABT7SBV3_9CELL|nr:exodeoxyribonuclease V subunit gamma [Cellulomonas alba]MDM7853665.1 exodeoxyribonuclease V subunit gamma [Cellulomonas alba]